jgi:large subunit ribosomal protein L30
MADVRVTQVRSAASRKADQGRTLRALGLTRIRSSVVHEDRPEILGMINKVSHLVEVEPANGRADGDRKRRRSGSPPGQKEAQ